MEDFIGKEVRIITFGYDDGEGNLYNVLSIIEELYPFMEDYDSFVSPEKPVFVKSERLRKSNGKDQKVVLTIFRTIATDELVKHPEKEIKIDGDPLLSYSQDFNFRDYIFVSPSNNNRKEICQLLPLRNYSSEITYKGTTELSPQFNKIISDEKFQRLLSKLSLNNLGFNLEPFRNFFGGYLFISYNEVYSSLNLSTNAARDTVFARINFRPGERQVLNFLVVSYDENGNPESIDVSNEGNFIFQIPVSPNFKYLGITVRDQNGRLLDKLDRVVFIKSIKMDMALKIKDLAFKDGEVTRIVEKFISEQSVIGAPEVKKGNDPVISLFDSSEEYSYKKFEDSLDFIFFSGSKDDKEKAENLKKAKEAVLRILNSARHTTYICDIFFGWHDLKKYVLEIGNITSEVRILSSKEKLTKESGEREAILETIDLLYEKGCGKIKFRLFKGEKAALHDRLIIADEKVWMLGSSLNEFGSRATTIIRVPQDYAGKIISHVEEWWNNPDFTEPLK